MKTERGQLWKKKRSREKEQEKKREIRRKYERRRERIEGSAGVCMRVVFQRRPCALTCMLKTSSELSDWPVMLLTSLDACDDSEDEE